MRDIKLMVGILLSIPLFSNAQSPVPAGFPSPYSTNYYRVGFLQEDSGGIYGIRDTTARPRFAGFRILWAHAGKDTSVWVYNGSAYIKQLNTQDTLPGRFLVTPSFLNSQGYLKNITGFIQQGTGGIKITGSGTLVSPFLISDTTSGGSFVDTTILPGLFLNQNLVGTVKTIFADSAGLSAYYLRRVDSNLYTTRFQLSVSLSGKQNTITTGATTQYFRGDFSLATFPTNLASFINGPGYITGNQPITFTPSGGDINGTFTHPTLLTPTLTINSNVVSYSKIQTATGQGLMGAQSAGNFQLVTLGSGLSMTAGVLSATGGGGGSPNVNIGSGFRWAVAGTNNVKTVFGINGVLIDSASGANALTFQVDSGAYSTRLRVQKAIDSLGVVKQATITSFSNQIIFNNGGTLGGSGELVFVHSGFQNNLNVGTSVSNDTATLSLGGSGSAEGIVTNTSGPLLVNGNSSLTLEVANSPKIILGTTTITVTGFSGGSGGLVVTNSSGVLSKSSATNSTLWGVDASGNTVPIILGTNLSFTGTTINAAGGGSIPPNIGSGFREYAPQTPGFKSFFGSLIIIDSITNANALTFTADTTAGSQKLETQGRSDRTYYPLVGGNITGTAGVGFLGLPVQSSSPLAQANITEVYRDSAGGISFRYPSGFINALRALSAHTANRSYFFPDSSGTFMLSSLPSGQVWVGNGSGLATAGTLPFSSISNSTANTLFGWNSSGVPTNVTITTIGTSGPSTLVAGVLNIPQYSGGGGVDSGIAVLNGILATRTSGPTVFLQVDSSKYATVFSLGKAVQVIGAIDNYAPVANGLKISGDTLYGQSETSSFPGFLNNTTQTISGPKTLTSNLTITTLGSTFTASGTLIGTNTPNDLQVFVNATNYFAFKRVTASFNAGLDIFPSGIGSANKDGYTISTRPVSLGFPVAMMSADSNTANFSVDICPGPGLVTDFAGNGIVWTDWCDTSLPAGNNNVATMRVGVSATKGIINTFGIGSHPAKDVSFQRNSLEWWLQTATTSTLTTGAFNINEISNGYNRASLINTNTGSGSGVAVTVGEGNTNSDIELFRLAAGHSSAGVFAAGCAGLYIPSGSTTSLSFITGSTLPIIFATNTTERGRIVGATGDVLWGTTTDVVTSIFTLASTTQGMLIPRMNTTQQNAIASPANGLIIWNTDSLGLVDYNGTAWLKERAAGGGGGAVSSVSNSDGTLTISPTTGAVVASLALSHANTWSALQTFGTLTTTSTTKFTTLPAGAATDSILTWNASTGQVNRIAQLADTFNLANGLTLTTISASNHTGSWGGVLTQNTTIDASASNFNVTLGSTNFIGVFTTNFNTSSTFNTGSGGNFIFTGNGIRNSQILSGDANVTLGAGVNSMIIELQTITANRTVTLSSPAAGQTYEFDNINTSASNNWTFSTTVSNPTGGAVVNIPIGRSKIYYNGAWILVSQASIGNSVNQAGVTGSTGVVLGGIGAAPYTGTYRIDAYLTVNSISVDQLQMIASYTDETGTARTVVMIPVGGTSGVITSTGLYSYSYTVRVQAGSSVGTQTQLLVTTGSLNYDAGSTVTLISTN